MERRGIGVAWSVWSPGGEREPNPNPNPNGFSLFFCSPDKVEPVLAVRLVQLPQGRVVDVLQRSFAGHVDHHRDLSVEPI